MLILIDSFPFIFHPAARRSHLSEHSGREKLNKEQTFDLELSSRAPLLINWVDFNNPDQVADKELPRSYDDKTKTRQILSDWSDEREESYTLDWTIES